MIDKGFPMRSPYLSPLNIILWGGYIKNEEFQNDPRDIQQPVFEF